MGEEGTPPRRLGVAGRARDHLGRQPPHGASPHVEQPRLPGQGLASQTMALALTGGSGALTYVAALWLLKVEEARPLVHWALGRLRRPFAG